MNWFQGSIKALSKLDTCDYLVSLYRPGEVFVTELVVFVQR